MTGHHNGSSNAHSEAFPASIMQDILAKRWAELNLLLFDGAFNYTVEDQAGGRPVVIDQDGSLAIKRVLDLPLKIGSGVLCPVSSNSAYPFPEI